MLCITRSIFFRNMLHIFFIFSPLCTPLQGIFKSVFTFSYLVPHFHRLHTNWTIGRLRSVPLLFHEKKKNKRSGVKMLNVVPQSKVQRVKEVIIRQKTMKQTCQRHSKKPQCGAFFKRSKALPKSATL